MPHRRPTLVGRESTGWAPIGDATRRAPWSPTRGPARPSQCPRAGAPGRTRTCDLGIRRPLLYPAELRGQWRPEVYGAPAGTPVPVNPDRAAGTCRAAYAHATCEPTAAFTDRGVSPPRRFTTAAFTDRGDRSAYALGCQRGSRSRRRASSASSSAWSGRTESSKCAMGEWLSGACLGSAAGQADRKT